MGGNQVFLKYADVLLLTVTDRSKRPGVLLPVAHLTRKTNDFHWNIIKRHHAIWHQSIRRKQPTRSCALQRFSWGVNGTKVAASLTLNTEKDQTMNTDQVKGALKEVAGKIQSTTGELIDSPEQEAKGLLKQSEGQVQKTVGDAKEVLKDAVDKI